MGRQDDSGDGDEVAEAGAAAAIEHGVEDEEKERGGAKIGFDENDREGNKGEGEWDDEAFERPDDFCGCAGTRRWR